MPSGLCSLSETRFLTVPLLLENTVSPPAKHISSVSNSHAEIKGNKEKYSNWEQSSMQQSQCFQTCRGTMSANGAPCDQRSPDPRKIFFQEHNFRTEGEFVHFKTIEALSQQGLLVPPKPAGRKADTYGLPGLREEGNSLAERLPLHIPWKPRHSLETLGFLQIFTTWQNMLSWKNCYQLKTKRESSCSSFLSELSIYTQKYY